MARVSVIIPTYNSAQFVTQAVESVLAQTYGDVETIVVDDGSTDNTRSALARYGGNIRYIYQENGGPAAARNTGVAASRGAFLLFLDSDDLILARKLELQTSFLEENPSYGLVYSAWQQISEDGRHLLGEVRPRKQGLLLKEILCRELFFFLGTALLRRTCLETVGPFDESLRWGEDADLWLRLARAGVAFGYIDLPLFQYRFHSASITAQVDGDQVKSWMATLEKFFADDSLPEEIKALQARAYGVLHYETAARYYRAGQIKEGQAQLRAALSRYPSMDREWLLEWAAGSALDPRTALPQAFMDRLFDNLPSEATELCALRRRVEGRYHTSAAFRAHQLRQFRRARRHILPAILGDPAVLRNRGFWRVSAEALFR